MHPEFIFDGKKYISAKSASLLTGYTSDYIGQLCRASKIDSRRIGRVWYVCENALLNYEKNVRVPVTVAAISPLNVHEVLEKTTAASATQTINAASASKESKVEPVSVVHTINVAFPSFALPKFAPSVMMVATGIFTAILLSIVVAPNIFSSITESTGTTTPSIEITRSITKTPEIVAAASQSSFVSNALVSLVRGVNRIALMEYASITTVFGGSPTCTVANDYCMSAATYKGVVVMAQSGDVSVDTQVKTTIQQNFSDEVRIWSDESGTSGVIEPVFKKDTGDTGTYSYVVVPVSK